MQDFRFEVALRLKQLVTRKNIFEIATELGITIIKDGNLNKGWVGQTFDKLANTLDVNAQKPDGVDFELKCIKVVSRKNEWNPGETMAITMFNPANIMYENFEDSALWHKLERLILIGCSYDTDDPPIVTTRFIRPVDVSDRHLIDSVKDYWLHIKDRVTEGTISDYSSKGTSDGFIQLRTKGSSCSTSTCPITGRKFSTRAFYATKPFLRYVLGVMGE